MRVHLNSLLEVILKYSHWGASLYLIEFPTFRLELDAVVPLVAPFNINEARICKKIVH
jgi:hypothetical protein